MGYFIALLKCDVHCWLAVHGQLLVLLTSGLDLIALCATGNLNSLLDLVDRGSKGL